MGIDLHIHSTASDGTFSPPEIISLAHSLNMGAIAITDHDTIDGSKEAFTLDIPPSLKLLAGVEISVSSNPSLSYAGSFHMLGYSIRLDDPVLNRTLDMLQDARRNRNPRIVKLLNKIGINFSLKDVADEFSEGQLGRPHIAQLMVKRGFVKSINEAFDKYLGTGRPAYVDKYRLDCGQAIEIILAAGGIPVLAHPFFLQIENKDRFENLIVNLKEMGLKGIEAYYPEHSPDLTAFYAEVANRYGLLITGGTDFHGSIKPDVKMGSGRGDLFVPYELYEKLINS
ncbi:MAG: PHP domain-containing protein [Proteobacteria bacterium]|nr:PHP domain-containing protein [Pseudomonadota bacterium]MBU4463240.1 PHP domain-containing protein [Pseudomonadota bacterium]